MKICSALAPLALAAGLLLAGCNDNARKTADPDEVCRVYKERVAKIMADPDMTDQDRRNMIPRIAGYSSCGSEADLPGGPAPAANPANDPSAAQQRDAQQRGGQ
ncbi:MAG: hypothetical protein MH204_02305 [Fimbriimonadaceae bacterium]|nr:hypothetical protein [Fimbriimonadaceae bacterium]